MEKRMFVGRGRGPAERQPQLIGVLGAGPCVGTTHFAVWLANYLSGMRREKTAVLEWNDHADVDRISRVCAGKVSSPFRLLDVTYYGQAGGEELSRCFNQAYRHIIIDFGHNDRQQWTEFLRCGRRYLIVSLSEWQQEAFADLVEDKGLRVVESCTLLAAFGSEESRKEAIRNLGIPILRIPFSVDAFIVTKEAVSFFESMF